MWFFDALASGFQHPTDPARLQAFRIVFGAVITARFALSFGQGGWDRPRLAQCPRGRTALRPGARPAAGRGLPACADRPHRRGCRPGRRRRPRLALLLVLAGAAMELLYLKSPNAVRYTLLTGACLLLAGDLGTGLHIAHGSSTANTWAQVLMVVVTTDIYWNSAWQNSGLRSSAAGCTSRSGCMSTARCASGSPIAASTPSPASSAATWATSPTATSACGGSSRQSSSPWRSHYRRRCSLSRRCRTPSPPASGCTSPLRA
ncbi:hypothetical protein ACR6C2_07370 [Streptomyces sp. INA 01156]